MTKGNRRDESQGATSRPEDENGHSDLDLVHMKGSQKPAYE